MQHMVDIAVRLSIYSWVLVLALTWIGHFRREERTKTSIWIAIGISAICAVFIGAGIKELLG
jgi:hypothetical protein